MTNKIISVKLLPFQWKNIISILQNEANDFGWIIYKELQPTIDSIINQTKLKVKK